jgi:hypothetical protein
MNALLQRSPDNAYIRKDPQSHKQRFSSWDLTK